MLEMLRARKEQLKAEGKKGFTLMEMLIVVAIIAVLIAIAIPIFTAELEKSREATDLANVRSAYAELSAKYLTWDGTSTIAAIEVPVKQVQDGWQTDGGAANTTISEGHDGAGVSVPAKTSGNYKVEIATTGTTAGTVTVS